MVAAAAAEPTLHPFVSGPVETLPAAGEVWAEDGRQQWLDAAAAIFKLIYKDPKAN